MKILISGGSGFIGSNLAKSFLENGNQVHVLLRSETHLNDSSLKNGIIRHIVASNSSPSEMLELIEKISPNVVIHAATKFVAQHKSSDIDEIIDANVAFGTHLLEAVMRSQLRLEFININSSWQNFQEHQRNARTLYAASKIAFNEILNYFSSVSNFTARSVVLFDTYGPLDTRRKVVDVLIEAAMHKRPLAMSDGYQLINLTHVDDVCDAIKVLAYSNYENLETFQIKSRDTISIRQLVAIIEEISGEKIMVNWGALESRPYEMTFDWNVATDLPGWEPKISLHAGILEKVAAFRLHSNTGR